jgi:hypothetical protein
MIIRANQTVRYKKISCEGWNGRKCSESCPVEGFCISAVETVFCEGKITYTSSRKYVLHEKLYFA